MVTAEKTGFSQESFEDFLRSRSEVEPIWVTDARKRSWNRFLSVDWPSRRDEEWMRSDLRPFRLGRYSIPIGMEQQDHSLPSRFSGEVEFSGKLISRNGAIVGSQVDDSLSKTGAIFSSLDESV